MHENPFSDAVPTPLAISATVYTKPMVQLQEELKTTRSKLILLVGDYGSGKTHTLERLKNDVNINNDTKLAAYTSAYATKSLRAIYEQITTDLVSGKFSKLDLSPENKVILESKGIPEKIIALFYDGNKSKTLDEVKLTLPFGKVVASSPDVVNFIAALSLLVDQFILLIDDIEEAAGLDKAERQTFLGNLRALYDQAVRSDLNIVTIATLTPEKLELLKDDRLDFYERVDKRVVIEKPSFKEFNDIVQKRLDVSALTDLTLDKNVLKGVWSQSSALRSMFNSLRDVVEDAWDKGISKVTEFKPPKIKVTPVADRAPYPGYKPADDIILGILKESPGVGAPEIVTRSEKSDPWIRHRLADLVTEGVLRKEQAARNRPAKYFLTQAA